MANGARSDPTKAKSIRAAWFVVPLAALLLLLVLLGAHDLMRNAEEGGARWEIWQQDGPDPERDRDLIGGGDGFNIDRSFLLQPNDLILGGGFAGALDPGRYAMEFVVGNASVTSVTVDGVEATCIEGSGNGTASGASLVIGWRAEPNGCRFALQVIQVVEPSPDHTIRWRHEWNHPTEGQFRFRMAATGSQ